MKKKWTSAILTLALAASVLVGCGAKEPAATSSAPAASFQAEVSVPVEKADYTDLVLDTAGDEGKLTVRYFATEATYTIGDDKVNVGDCAVYTSPEGLVMMIDCSNPAAFPEVDAYLQTLGIEKIDIFVMSHPHSDHIGCFAEVAEKYPIGQLYKNAHEYQSGAYQKAMAAIEEKNIPVTVLHDGDSFMFGEEVEVKVYGPSAKMEKEISKDVNDANNGSLALRMTYGDSSFWTAGDNYINGEQDIVATYGDAIRSDVVKMNHHGYDTSNSKEYIEALSPKVAVSMHESMTSKTVALRYFTRGAETFYTCMDGTIRVSTTGDGTYDVQSQYVRSQSIYGEPAADGHYTID